MLTEYWTGVTFSFKVHCHFGSFSKFNERTLETRCVPHTRHVTVPNKHSNRHTDSPTKTTAENDRNEMTQHSNDAQKFRAIWQYIGTVGGTEHSHRRKHSFSCLFILFHFAYFDCCLLPLCFNSMAFNGFNGYYKFPTELIQIQMSLPHLYTKPIIIHLIYGQIEGHIEVWVEYSIFPRQPYYTSNYRFGFFQMIFKLLDQIHFFSLDRKFHIVFFNKFLLCQKLIHSSKDWYFIWCIRYSVGRLIFLFLIVLVNKRHRKLKLCTFERICKIQIGARWFQTTTINACVRMSSPCLCRYREPTASHTYFSLLFFFFT